MSLTHLRSRLRHDGQAGFTLIELLVVILIIGILASIAIPSFLGQVAKARDSGAKSNVRNAVSAMESCFTDQQSYVNCTNDSAVKASGIPTGTAKGQVNVTGQSTTGYTATATSDSNNTFTVTNAGGTYTYKCTNTGSSTGGCVTNNGSW